MGKRVVDEGVVDEGFMGTPDPRAADDGSWKWGFPVERTIFPLVKSDE